MVIDYLDILIGSACNLKCPYCLQNTFNCDFNKKINYSSFANKLLNYFYINRLERMPTRISYWGGEPLLYINTIKEIHGILKLHGVIPKFCSRISTNGTLIDDDYIKWANENKDVRTTVSLHGLKYLSRSNFENISKLNNCVMTELMHRGNIDIEKLKKVYYEYEIPISLNFIRANDINSKDYFFDYNDVDAFISNLKKILKENDAFSKNILDALKKDKRKYINMSLNENYCVGSERLSIDINGNSYGCHHDFSRNNIIGNLFNKKIIKIKEINYNKFYHSTECQNCGIKFECRGSCPISLTHSVDCYLSKELHKVIMEYD